MNQQKWTLASKEDRHDALHSIGVADSMKHPYCDYYSDFNWDQLSEEIRESFEEQEKDKILLALEEASGFFKNPCSGCGERVKWEEEPKGYGIFLNSEEPYIHPNCARCLQLAQIQKGYITT